MTQAQTLKDRVEQLVALRIHKAKISIPDRECMRIARDVVPDAIAAVLAAVKSGEVRV